MILLILWSSTIVLSGLIHLIQICKNDTSLVKAQSMTYLTFPFSSDGKPIITKYKYNFQEQFVP